LLGFSHPLPEELVAEFASNLEAILVVEETEPVLEADVKATLFDAGELMPVYGRRSGHMPREYELTPGTVEKAVRELLAETAPELELPPRSESVPASAPAVELPSRSPVLCPGCPHRHTYFAAKRAVTALKRKGLEPIFPSDIGCYSLGLAPPFHMADIMLSMGASVGTAGGFDAATEQPVVAFIGDSTFFHAGLPALASAVHNGHNFTLVILDNRTTAMTGHQPHPGIELRAPGDENRVELHELSIPAAVRGLGVPWIAEVDPNQLQETQKKVREAVGFDGVSVVVSQAPCVLLSRHEVPDTTYSINLEVCADCGVCIERFGCPAIVRDEGVLKIDARLCNSCGVCMQVCPHDAIEEVPAE
jgi:indolepyruvate ferredoxin oxidoreductase alpha subunit